MIIEFEPTRLLAYALSLVNSPYKSYFRGLAIWDTAIEEEEEALKDKVLSTPALRYLVDISRGAVEKDIALEHNLRTYFLSEIPTDYGHSSRVMDSVLFFLIGYDVKSQKLLHERREYYSDRFKQKPFFLDTLVEVERYREIIQGPLKDSLTVLKNYIADNKHSHNNIIKLITFYTHLENLSLKEVNKHTESYKTNLKLVEEFNPSACLGYLRYLNRKVSSRLETDLMSTTDSLLAVTFMDMKRLIKECDVEEILTDLLSGEESDTRLLLELFVVISAITIYENKGVVVQC